MSYIRKRRAQFPMAALLLLVPYLCSGKAQAEEVTLSFDGTASPGGIFVKAGGDQPTFVAGPHGQAMVFGEGAVVAVPFDIDARRHPQVTVSLWLKAGAESATQGYLFSPGDGNNLPFIQIAGGRHVTVMGRRADGSGVLESDISLPLDEWVPVAVVWDYDNRTIRLQVGTEVKLFENLLMDVAGGDVGAQRKYVAPNAPAGATSQAYVFIGARNFRYGFPANGYAIDDVRIFTRALSEAEVAALGAGSSGAAASPVTQGAGSAGPGLTCAALADCETGFYCAYDRTCHPDSHRPLQALVDEKTTDTCDAVSQTGCGPTEKCTLVSDGTGGTSVGCAPDGTVPLGGACASPTMVGMSDDCVSGTLCVEGVCVVMPMVPASEQVTGSSTGGQAAFPTSSILPAGVTQNAAGMRVVAPETAADTCDAVSQMGCGPSEKCALVSDGAGGTSVGCAPDGTVPLGGACASSTMVGMSDDCVSGTLCVEGVCVVMPVVPASEQVTGSSTGGQTSIPASSVLPDSVLADAEAKRIDVPTPGYESEEDAQADAEERAQEASTQAVSDAAGSTQQVPEQPSPTLGYDGQILVFSGVSGRKGTYSEQVVFTQNQGILKGLKTHEENDKPCSVDVYSTPVVNFTKQNQITVDACSEGVPKIGGIQILDNPGSGVISQQMFSAISAITAIQVCDSSYRVKGIRAQVRGVNPADGSLQAGYRTETLFERNRCGVWRDLVSCLAPSVAVGVTLYFQDGTVLAPKDYLTGVELVCSELTLR